MAAVLTLYSRRDCLLCDLAEWALREHPLTHVLIDGDATLEAHFGQRVPVLANACGDELDWPFEPQALQQFIKQAGT